ncbi:MAG: glycosyltransferase family 2 protein [Rhodospirillales bacterium]|nr:glycosyltransferase family 2 protein [Rhodospirillales bacterium]
MIAPALPSQATSPAPDIAPDLAIVVPVYNEQDNIEPLIREIKAALDEGSSYEIIYVDDGSTDATPDRLKAMEALSPSLKAIRHRDRTGQSTAIATGVRAAGAPVIATLDGDGQNDPADIPKLLQIFNQSGNRDFILVAGLRANRKDTLLKRLSSRIANRVRARLLGDDTPDTGCGLKIFSRAAFLDMPRFDHMHRFLPALMIRQGGMVISVPVNHRPRQRGQSKYGLWDRLWVGIFDLIGVMWLLRRASNAQIEQDEKDPGQ